MYTDCIYIAIHTPIYTQTHALTHTRVSFASPPLHKSHGRINYHRAKSMRTLINTSLAIMSTRAQRMRDTPCGRLTCHNAHDAARSDVRRDRGDLMETTFSLHPSRSPGVVGLTNTRISRQPQTCACARVTATTRKCNTRTSRLICTRYARGTRALVDRSPTVFCIKGLRFRFPRRSSPLLYRDV